MQAKHLVALIVLGAIWGASFMFMRIATPEFGAITLVFVRTLLAAIVLLPFVFFAKAWRDFSMYWKEITFVGLINTAVPFALFNYTSLHLLAGVNAILNATAPMFAGLIGFIWLKDKLTMTAIIGLLLGFAGVISISAENTSAAGISVLPITAALAATFCYGLSANYIKQKLTRCNPLALAAGSQVAATILLLGPSLMSLPQVMPSTVAWLSALSLAIFGTGIAYILYFYLIAKAGPAKAITVGYLVPLFGIIWGIVFLGEQLSLLAALGGAMILVGVMLTTGFFSKKKASKTAST